MTSMRITAGIVLTACIAFPANAQTTSSDKASDRIEVTADIRDVNTQLEITWTATNRGDIPVFILMRPLEQQFKARNGTIYIGPGTPGEIEFALRAPKGMNPTTLDRIGAAPLEPGQHLEGKTNVVQRLPLLLPYDKPMRQRPLLRRVKFCVGFLKVVPNLPGKPRLSDGAIALHHESRAISRPRVACSQRMTLPGSAPHG